MKRDAKKEAEEFLKQLRNKMWDAKIHDSRECAILAQQRILELDVWNSYNEEELRHQREILKEIKKL